MQNFDFFKVENFLIIILDLGFSYRSMTNKIFGHPNVPILLLMKTSTSSLIKKKDQEGQHKYAVIGAFLDLNIRHFTSEFTGNDHACVFRVSPHPIHHKATSKNDFFFFCDKNNLYIGGGGQGCAITFGNDMRTGLSMKSETFGNDPLHWIRNIKKLSDSLLENSISPSNMQRPMISEKDFKIIRQETNSGFRGVKKFQRRRKSFVRGRSLVGTVGGNGGVNSRSDRNLKIVGQKGGEGDAGGGGGGAYNFELLGHIGGPSMNALDDIDADVVERQNDFKILIMEVLALV